MIPFDYLETAPIGVILGESESFYHSTGWLGYTPLKEYNASPFAWHKRHIEKHPDWKREQTAAFSMGTLVDELLTAGGPKSFVTVPDTVLNAKGKPQAMITAKGEVSTSAAALVWIMQQAPKIPLTPHLLRKAEIMAASVRRNDTAMEHIEGAELQTVFRCKHHDTGLPMQCRTDFYRPGAYVHDLKTTRDSLEYPSSIIKKYGYHIQAGYYQAIIRGLMGEELPWFITFVQNVYPFESVTIELGQRSMNAGLEIAENALCGIADQRFKKTQSPAEVIEIRGIY